MALRPLAACCGLAVLASLLTSAAGWGNSPSSSRQSSQYAETLRDHEIEPTGEGLADYLRALHPTDQARERMRRLIADLGHEEFDRREKATRELLRLPVCCPAVLEEATESADPEIRWRARQVQKLGAAQTDQLLFAAFMLIREEETPGLTRPVIEAFRFTNARHVLRQGRLAAAASATEDDLPWLRTQLGEGTSDEAAAAVVAIERVLGPASADDLLPLLDAEDETLRLAAAAALLNHGRRESLSALVDLLEADALAVRMRAAHLLRVATGERFQFAAYDKPESRAASAAEWREWVRRHGESAELTIPIRDTDVEFGRTLICFYKDRKIVELDDAGNEIWSKNGIDGPWDCDGTPAGHRVVCSYSDRSVFEFDESGEEIWRIDNVGGRPFSVQRLENGNTLVACYDNGKIIEFRPDKTVAWERTLTGTPMDAQRLDNGHTLVTLYQAQKVVEIDQGGKVVWELPNLTRPRTAQRLANGNTLVTETSARKVAEYDRDKKQVWSHANVNNPLDAQRLSNGNTLISSSGGIVEVTPDGREIPIKKVQNPSRVCRY